MLNELRVKSLTKAFSYNKCWTGWAKAHITSVPQAYNQ